MANVLGTLFGDIAAAIREKNGETGTMKPAEFPEKISAIETGSSSKTLTMKSGTFTPDGSVATISHELGVVPDIVIVWDTRNASSTAIMAAIGFSADVMSALGGGYLAKADTYNEETGVALGVSDTEPITSYGEYQRDYGLIHSATTTTFSVGSDYSSDSFGLSTSVKYRWIAISGII